MAGLGRKVFAASEILTAANVQNYLMDQTVMIFNDTTDRSTVLGTAVSEGMVTYLNNSNSLEVYNGSAWTPMLTSGTITGTQGYTAISNGQNGVTYQPVSPNYIINGAFDINQRGFTSTTFAEYTFDRWLISRADGTVTTSAQTFTPGAAPVAGYESANFIRMVTAGQSLATAEARIIQRIEDVRTLAGQTATVSFWAKSGSGTPNVTVELLQAFGTGGSPSATVTGILATNPKQAISTSWQRYSYTFSVPSISGKTIGTDANSSSLQVVLWVSAGTNLNARTSSLGVQNNTFDFWGVQLEAGSVATPFRRNANSLQGELAACQRYYFRISPNATTKLLGIASAANTTQGGAIIPFPVQMRIAPTALETSGTANQYAVNFAGTQTVCSLVPSYQGLTTEHAAFVTVTVAAGLTAGQAGRLTTDVTNGANAYLGWSAEL